MKFLFKYFLFLSCIVNSLTSAGITSEDTVYINHNMRRARQVHYSNPDSAIFYYQQIIDYRQPGSEILKADLTNLEKAYLETLIRAQNYLGNIYYYDDEYTRADYYYRRSLEIAQKAGFREHIANSLYDVGYTCYVTNDFEKAAGMFRESYDRFTESGNKQGMFDAIQAYALAQRHLGNLERSDSCNKLGLELARAIGDSVQIADVWLNNGILLCEEGNLEEGTRLFEQALQYYEAHGEKEAASLALLNIGVVMKMLGEYDKALAYIKQSTAIEEALQQKSQLVVRYYNLADLYLEMKMNDMAYEFCRKTLSVAGEIGSKPFVAECDLLIGKYYYLEGQGSEAAQYLQLAGDSARARSDLPLLTEVLLWHSRNKILQNEVQKAIDMAGEAESLAVELKLLQRKKEAALILSEAYEKAGNAGLALTWMKSYQVYSDSLNYQTQHDEIRKIEAKYNYDKKDRENELLRNRSSLQQQKLRNRNFITLALVTWVLLSIAIMILLSKRSRDAKLLYQQQQMLNLEHLRELEQELDGKNRELTSKMMFLSQKNDLISRLIHRLQEIRDTEDNTSEEILSIVNELRTDAPQSSWKEFEAQFIQVHPGFYNRLFERHPDLTSYEQRICAFLRINLNTKEMASITGRSAKSIEVTRSRIRTKLKLKRDQNLSSYLAAI